MDDAGPRERRSALRHRTRRRRRLVLSGALVALIALALVLTTRGGDSSPVSGHPQRPAARQAAAGQHARGSVPAPGSHARAAAIAGARRAPHEAVPILMYHVIGDLRPGTPNPTLWVSPANFAAHVEALARGGYHAVTLQAVWDAWRNGATLPRRPVVISFDDGYRGQVRNALPTLARQGWAGVLNLKLGNLADMGGTRAIKRMIRAGWEIDSHTITHPDLTTVSASALRHELVGSRTRLKRYFHVPASFFCYPSGRYDAAVIAAVKKAGYRAATTTRLGWARPGQDPFTLPRVRVDGGMSATALLQRISAVRSASSA